MHLGVASRDVLCCKEKAGGGGGGGGGGGSVCVKGKTNSVYCGGGGGGGVVDYSLFQLLDLDWVSLFCVRIRRKHCKNASVVPKTCQIRIKLALTRPLTHQYHTATHLVTGWLKLSFQTFINVYSSYNTKGFRFGIGLRSGRVRPTLAQTFNVHLTPS